MKVLLAIVVMLSVALFAGVLLSVFSHFFAVPENPLKRKIRQCLPGINCGACGYKGCSDYTDALLEGNVSPSLCIPGAQEVANQIAELMGVKPEPFKDVTAFVSCNGTCDASSRKALYEGLETCRAANMLYAGQGACRFGCLGFGDCAKVCPAEAICLYDGVAHVNTARCLGCTLCSDVCPKHIIKMMPQETKTVVACSNLDRGADARKACQNSCIACKKCEKVCPHDAISVQSNLAVIDYEKCTNCKACVAECPSGCLTSVFFPDRPKDISCQDLLS